MARFLRSSFVVALVVGLAGPAFAQPKAPAAADDLSLLPVDSELVAGLDFQKLQASALWKQFVEPMLSKGDVAKQMNEFKASCGIDPMKAVTKIAMGLKGFGGTAKPDGVVVAHGVSKEKLVACFEKLSKQKKPDANITRDGDVLLVKPKGDQPLAFTFINDSTALMVIGTNATTAGIKATAKGTSALKKSPAFVDIYNKTNTNDTLWMIMNGNSKAFDQLGAMGIKPKAVFGSVNVTKDLALDVRARFGTGDEAKNLAAMMNGQIKGAAGMFDKLTVAADGSDVKVNIFMSDAKLKAFAKQFGPMMGKP